MHRYALATFHRRIRTRAFGVETNSAAVPTARRRDSRSGGAVDRARPGERLSRRTAAYLGAGDAELYVARFGGPMPAKGAQASGNRGAQSQRVDRQVSGAPRWSGARFDDKMIALLYLRDTTSDSPIPIHLPRRSAGNAAPVQRAQHPRPRATCTLRGQGRAGSDLPENRAVRFRLQKSTNG